LHGAGRHVAQKRAPGQCRSARSLLPMAFMTTNLPARPIYLGMGFGHAATLEKSSTGGRVVIRGPRGVAPVILDITVTEARATVRVREEILCTPPSTVTSAPPPAVEVGTPPAIETRPSTPQSLPVPTPVPARVPTLVPVPAPVTSPLATEPAAPKRRLTLLEYATLRAACVTASPEQLPALRSRYLLDEASDAVEAQAWSRKFTEDPALFATYKHHFQQFRSRTVPSPAVGGWR
jgi:hypothetical protein